MSTETERSEAPRARPYSGYLNDPAPKDDTFLTDVGRGSPCGEYLRRYWQPFMLASELKDLPIALRLLGEDLVAFRDLGGRVGLLHRHCIHRGASLEFGIPVERGIMCCYHGWHFDIDGSILATPAEPTTNRITRNFTQGAYPVHEYHGLLFAYMGPPDSRPEFPIYDTFVNPEGNRLVPSQREFPCNWLQIVENAADPIHNHYLHAIVSQQFSTAFNEDPALEFVETPLGFICSATRRVRDFVFIRASEMILPNAMQFTRGGREWKDEEMFTVGCAITKWTVPIDNLNSWSFQLQHLNPRTQALRKVRAEDLGKGKLTLIGQTADRPYEERQRQPGDYDALVGQGAVSNRKLEHLGNADRGIVLLRRQLARGINACKSGETPAMPKLALGEALRTYCHEVVVRAPDPAQYSDRASLGGFGQRAARIVVESGDVDPALREKAAEERIRGIFSTEAVV